MLLAKLETSLGYQFKQAQLLEVALRHRSVGNPNNERLEFLGDAMLGAIIADELFKRFPNGDEGQLTRLRSSLVKKDTLADLAREVELGGFIKLGEGERKTAGWRRSSILENTLEALIGAVYLDSNFEQCQTVVLRLFEPLLEQVSLEDIQKDPKSRLQEYLQSMKLPTPEYEVLSSTGKSHQQVFTVSCCCENLPTIIQAEGASRRKAEQAAAQQALNLMQKNGRN